MTLKALGDDSWVGPVCYFRELSARAFVWVLYFARHSLHGGLAGTGNRFASMGTRWLVDMVVLYRHYADFLISMPMPPKVGHSEPDMAHSFIPTRLTP